MCSRGNRTESGNKSATDRMNPDGDDQRLKITFQRFQQGQPGECQAAQSRHDTRHGTQKHFNHAT